MTITRPQAEALATLTTRLRPDWDHPGVLAAIHKAQNLGSPFDIARALIALAENRDLNSPGMLSQPGRHWVKATGEATGPNVTNNVHCPEHPLSVHPCPQCAAKKCPPPTDYLEAKKALTKSRPRHDLTPPTRDPVAAQRLNEGERETARQLVEQEANR